MKVHELVKLLSDWGPDREVRIWDSNEGVRLDIMYLETQIMEGDEPKDRTVLIVTDQ